MGFKAHVFRAGQAAVACLLATGGLGSLNVSAATGPQGDPGAGHPYRHGAVWTQENWRAHGHNASTASGSGPLSYGGGVDGIGVTTGTPRIYIVFWGSQWGTSSTDSNGYLHFTGDPSGSAPVYQGFFKGLGTGNELWSGVMTQYCEGVSSGSTSCPSAAAHTGYPTGGALAGVWYDNSTAAPSQATGNQIANEAIRAAGHFGNTTASSNRSVQYAVVSPHGTHPDGFNTITGQFCAWHDWNGDTTLSGGAASSPYGDIAFTNMPYVTDMGTSCGQNYVNANGLNDGVTIVGGHEWAETITDQNPAGGWTDIQGYENGDKCAWISSGSGASQNIQLTTGTYAVQTTWSNDVNGCQVSHAIVGGAPANDFSMSASPSSLSLTAGSSGTSTVTTAVTSGSAGTVSLSVGGAPAGTTASLSPTSVTAGGSSTLTVSTTASAANGTYTLTVTGTEGSASHSTTVTLTVSGGVQGSVITNGGFESGSFSGWTTAGSTSISTTAHTGSYAARLGSTSPTNGDSSASQTFTVPSGKTALTFFYKMTCPDTVTYDWATATLRDNTSGTTTTVLTKTCATNSSWVQKSATVTAGHSYTLTLVSHDDNYTGDASYTLYDDVAVN